MDEIKTVKPAFIYIAQNHNEADFMSRSKWETNGELLIEFLVEEMGGGWEGEAYCARTFGC